MAWTIRYVRPDAAGGGDGTTDTASGTNGAWTLAEAITNEAAGMLIWVRATNASGTVTDYASTTTSRTLAAVGTTTGPVWWRGYNATTGDIELDNTKAKPRLTFTTGQLVVSGAHHILSNLDISGVCVTSGGQVNWTGGQGTLLRSRIENTAANSNARALSTTSGAAGFTLVGTWLRATSSAPVANLAGAALNAIGVTFRGGSSGAVAGSAGNYLACVFDDNGADGISCPGSVIQVFGCSFYSPGSDGIEFTALAANTSLIANSLFVNCAGYGVNNSTGSGTNLVRLIANGFYGNASGYANQITEATAITEDWPAALLNVALASNPFTDAANHDFSVTSAAQSLGFPGAFENESYVSYRDLGAVQSAGASPDATTYTVAGPTAGYEAQALTYAVVPDGVYSGTITPSDGGAGGTFSPTSLTWADEAGQKTFTYTQADAGAITLSFASSPALTDPSDIALTVSAQAAMTLLQLKDELDARGLDSGFTNAGAGVDVLTNADKTGYSLVSPQNFNNLGQTTKAPVTLAAADVTGNLPAKMNDVATGLLLSTLPDGAIDANSLTPEAIAAIQAGLSTYDGGDTSGTATLLGRLTSQRATNLDNLDATVGSRLADADYTAPTTPPTTTEIAAAILARPLTDTKDATVAGALHGAWANAWGKMVKDVAAKTLKLFGVGSQSTPAITFDLDSSSDPTTRTPQ